MQGRAVGTEGSPGCGPAGRPAHLLQKLDLVLQELVHVLGLLLPLLTLAPELGRSVAAEILHIGPETTGWQLVRATCAISQMDQLRSFLSVRVTLVSRDTRHFPPCDRLCNGSFHPIPVVLSEL